MGNVKFKVWDNPPSGEMADYIRESAFKAAVAVGQIEAGEHIINTAFGNYPNELVTELAELRSKFINN